MISDGIRFFFYQTSCVFSITSPTRQQIKITYHRKPKEIKRTYIYTVYIVCILLNISVPFSHRIPFHPGLHPNSQFPLNLLQLQQFVPHAVAQFGPYQPGRQAINDKVLKCYLFPYFIFSIFFFLCSCQLSKPVMI